METYTRPFGDDSKQKAHPTDLRPNSTVLESNTGQNNSRSPRTKWQQGTVDVLLALLLPLLLLILWEISVRQEWLDIRFFPAPTNIFVAAWQLLISGELIGDITTTLRRVMVGYVAGVIPGLILGIFMGLNATVRKLIWPLASAWYPVPKIAILPLVIILFGLGELPKVIIVAISVFFLVLLNAMTGVLQIDEGYRDVGRQLGAQPWQFIWSIALPGALPLIFAGLKLAMGFALLIIVGTEFLASDTGLGFMIWKSYQTFRIDRMFVGLVATGLMGWLLTVFLDWLEGRVIPWSRYR